MKTLKWDKLPHCDFCKKQTEEMFDVPTIHKSSWAHLCSNCLPIHGKNIKIGFKIIKKEKT